MLQNPSKYHTNPLSHFLALHTSTQALHNNSAHNSQAMSTSSSTGNTITPLHQQHHNHLHYPTQVVANHHYSHHNHLSSPHAHLIDAANTSLDVGKSFTIAAILGLQKSAIENNRKEYNNAINLSLNGSNSSNSSTNSNQNQNHQLLQHQHQQQQQRQQQQNIHSDEMDKMESFSITNNCNNNNNNNNINNNNINNNNKFNNNNNCNKSIANNNSFSSVNNFNCDNSAALVNRYLPTASTPSSSITTTTSAASFSASSHVRVSNFATAAAVAAAAAAAAAANACNGSTPSALQSLQQLHQHHAQQTSLNFHREKLKSENNAKKTSLKNKRVRTIFTPEQLERLEAEFERQQYMVGPERLYLAHTLQLTEAQVKVWFQNRRIKWRKHHLEITQQRLALLRQTQLPATSAAAATAGVAPTTATTLGITSSESITVNGPRSDSCEELDDIKHCNDMIQLTHGVVGGSRPTSESDLSICNDSLDADSIIDGGEET